MRMGMDTEPISIRRVLGIRYPLSRDPIFIEMTDPSNSLETVLMDTVGELEKAGKSHEAFQMQQSLKDHLLFVNGQQFSGDRPVQDIPFQEKFLEGEQVDYAEINLLKEHVGGQLGGVRHVSGPHSQRKWACDGGSNASLD